jgi:(R,R)-butanediol dehydrogenase/meso-butanediol dehydrogenase/diacetyl reductase
MLAVRYHDREGLRIEEIPEPTPGPGEVKVKVAYNGICGTDVHEYYSGPTWIPLGTHPRTGARSAQSSLGMNFPAQLLRLAQA